MQSRVPLGPGKFNAAVLVLDLKIRYSDGIFAFDLTF